jgi:hypothetical protein
MLRIVDGAQWAGAPAAPRNPHRAHTAAHRGCPLSGRWLLALLPLVGSLVLGATAMAAPPPPELIAAAPGDVVVIPTFEWLPVAGTTTYWVEMAADRANALLAAGEQWDFSQNWVRRASILPNTTECI